MKKRFLPILFLLIPLAVVLNACSDSLADALEEGTVATYTFYACTADAVSSDDETTIATVLAETPSAERAYKIGEVVSAGAFPTASAAEFDGYKRGYKIDGWLYYNNPRTDSALPADTVPSTVTLVAGEERQVSSMMVTPQPACFIVKDWSPITYTVRFDANGGWIDGDTAQTVTEQPCTYDTAEPLAKNPFVRGGYEFIGWDTQKDGTTYPTPYTDGQEVVNLSDTDGAVVTLYARWRKVYITITFDAHGDGDSVSGTMPKMEHISVDTPLPANAFTRTGYTFGGWTTADGRWYYADGETLTEYNWPDDDVTLYAVWNPIFFTVTLDANDGSGNIHWMPCQYGVAQPLLVVPFSRAGYDFVGWNTSADGAGTFYADGASLTLTSGDLVLYAQWKAQTYIVTFNANGGTGAMDAQLFTYDVEQSLSANAYTRPGWNYVGWSTDANATSALYTDGENVRITSDRTLYAVWKPLGNIQSASGVSVSYTATGMTFTVTGSYASYSWQIDGTANGTADTASVSYADYADGATHKAVAICYDSADIPHVAYVNFSVEAQH